MTKPSEVTVTDDEVANFYAQAQREGERVALAAFLAARAPDASAVSGANSVYRNGFNSCRAAVLRGPGG